MKNKTEGFGGKESVASVNCSSPRGLVTGSGSSTSFLSGAGRQQGEALLLRSAGSRRTAPVPALPAPASQETATIISVMNVPGPFAVILSRVINTVNN